MTPREAMNQTHSMYKFPNIIRTDVHTKCGGIVVPRMLELECNLERLYWYMGKLAANIFSYK